MVLPFSWIQFLQTAKWYCQTICQGVNMTSDNSWQPSLCRLEILVHFIRGAFLLCHAFFRRLSSSFFFSSSSGSDILLRGLDGRREEKDSVRFIYGGKKHQCFLQVEFCIMHCSQKILCSVVRVCYSILNGQGKTPIDFSGGWIHSFRPWFLFKKKKVAQPCWIMDALINFHSTISAV